MNRLSQRICCLSAIAVGLLVLPLSVAQAQIYKYRDSNGNVVFSDKRPPGSADEGVEEIVLPATNSTRSPDSRSSSAQTGKPPVDAPSPADIDYQTTIIEPADGSTIPMGPGNFVVSVSISPALAGGEQLQLVVDGSPAGAPQRSSAWELQNVYRGKHSLMVQRLSSAGEIIDRSQATTVYVLRPSIR